MFLHWRFQQNVARQLSVASGRKALGSSISVTRESHGALSAAMIDLAPLGYVLYATAALAFIWLLQNAAQL